MAVGLASQLCAHMIQAHGNRRTANTINSDVLQMKINHMLCYLFSVLARRLVEFMVFSTVLVPLSEGLFLHVVFKAKLEEKEKKKDLASQLLFKATLVL